MEIFKYRPWNKYTEDVIANSRIFYPSKGRLNDPSELIHPVKFEESVWHQSFQDAYDRIDVATQLLLLEVSKKFEFLDAVLESGHSEVLEDGGYQAYRSIGDPFLRKLEAVYDRAEVHQAILYYMLSHAEDRVLLYYPESEIVSRLDDKLSKLGVLSLSRRSDCPAMWAHYAANHRGVVLIFDTDRDPMFKEARNLSYVSTRPVLTVANVVDKLYEKSDVWSYEKEARIIKKKGDYSYGYREEALVGIILGMNMSQKTRKAVAKITKRCQHEIVLYEAKADPSSFALIRQPIDL